MTTTGSRHVTPWSAAWWSVTLVVMVTVRAGGAQDQIRDGRVNRTENACFSSSVTKTLVARCPSRHMVNILNLYYGHSTSGACAYTPGDCTLSDFLLHTCVGRQVCEVNLPSGDLGRQIPHCRLHSTYMQLVYQCIPEVEVHDVCDVGALHSQTGYIRTPAYPNNYPASRRCTVSITVHPTQRLRLQVVDLDLQSDKAGCSDMLYIQDAFRSSTLCGVRGPNQVFTTVGNKLNLTFLSDGAGRNKGFWLYYQAFPYMPPTTPPPTTDPPTPTWLLLSTLVLPPGGLGGSDSVLPPSHSTPQTEGAPNVTESTGRLSIEAIVGGLLGSLLCILLVLLILLIIKRRKEREAIPSSTSTCFLHSKAGSATRGGAPYIQNNLAMVEDSPMC